MTCMDPALTEVAASIKAGCRHDHLMKPHNITPCCPLYYANVGRLSVKDVMKMRQLAAAGAAACRTNYNAALLAPGRTPATEF